MYQLIFCNFNLSNILYYYDIASIHLIIRDIMASSIQGVKVLESKENNLKYLKH